MLFRFRALLLCLTGAATLHAHPQVSALVVETEFNAQRQFTVRVNLDPRLIVSDQPGTLPAATAAWYFDQSEATRAKTFAQAGQYLAKTLALKFGDKTFLPAWTFNAIDGATNVPLTADSAEAHLLASFTDPLPEAAGDFKLTLSPKCPVALILLNGIADEEERRPQSLFPGETSRGFPLPQPTGAASISKQTVTNTSASGPMSGIIPALKAGAMHDISDHLLLVLMLALGLRTRVLRAVAALVTFHIAHALAFAAVVTGLLPHASDWLGFVYWIGFAGAVACLFFCKDRTAPLLACMSMTGVCHAMNARHLHLPDAASGIFVSLSMSAGLFMSQLAALLVVAGIISALNKFVHPHGQQRFA